MAKKIHPTDVEKLEALKEETVGNATPAKEVKEVKEVKIHPADVAIEAVKLTLNHPGHSPALDDLHSEEYWNKKIVTKAEAGDYLNAASLCICALASKLRNASKGK